MTIEIKHCRQFTLLPAALLCLSLSGVVQAGAAGIPGIGDAMTQSVPVPPKKTTPPPTPEVPQVEADSKMAPSEEAGKTLHVKDFRVKGALDEDMAQVKELLEPYRGKDLSMEQITEVTNAVTLFYREKGYLVAKAYVPKQDASDGTLTVEVVLGEYGNFTVMNISPVKDSMIQKVFDSAPLRSRYVTRESLERSIMLVGEMPGTKVPTISIASGKRPGTSDMAVSVDTENRITGYFLGDNQGSEYTGENRFYGGITANSPLGIADRLTVSGMVTDKTDLTNGRVAYSVPLMANGLRAELAGSHVTYNLGGTYAVLDANGTADIVEGTLSYPLQRHSNRLIDVSLNLAYKKLTDDMDAVGTENPRNVKVATLAVKQQTSGALFGYPLTTTVTGSAALGDLEFEDDEQLALNQAGADTDGVFSKLKVDMSGNLGLTTDISLSGTLSFQKSLNQKNLDSSEQFFISGMAGVRAYTESVGFDNGCVASVEMRYRLPEFKGITHSVGLFGDSGWVEAEDGDYTTDDSMDIFDAGVGYYASFRNVFGTFQVAHPLGGSDSVEDPGTQFLLQMGAHF